MGKSFRKAILKDKGNSDYNKIIRRVNKQIVNQFKDNWKDELSETFNLYNKTEALEDKIKDPKEIVNQYDICDYKWNIEYNNDSWAKQRDLDKDKIKYRRK